MRPLFSAMRMVQPCDEVVRYEGKVEELSDMDLSSTLSDLQTVKPLLGWLIGGAVNRDAEGTFEWARWFCRLQQSQFDGDHIENCRLKLRLVTDPKKTIANFVFRMEPMVGDGSISYRAGISRIGPDDYVCFEPHP